MKVKHRRHTNVSYFILVLGSDQDGEGLLGHSYHPECRPKGDIPHPVRDVQGDSRSTHCRSLPV